ncbi:hypothetical protein D3C80_1778180 [compost metagenome]
MVGNGTVTHRHRAFAIGYRVVAYSDRTIAHRCGVVADCRGLRAPSQSVIAHGCRTLLKSDGVVANRGSSLLDRKRCIAHRRRTLVSGNGVAT